jgi:hypothetical protein
LLFLQTCCQSHVKACCFKYSMLQRHQPSTLRSRWPSLQPPSAYCCRSSARGSLRKFATLLVYQALVPRQFAPPPDKFSMRGDCHHQAAEAPEVAEAAESGRGIASPSLYLWYTGLGIARRNWGPRIRPSGRNLMRVLSSCRIYAAEKSHTTAVWLHLQKQAALPQE